MILIPCPVPVPRLQEHVYQAYEELLPYELFSLRLNNADLPNLPTILRGVTEPQYRLLVENLQRYKASMLWDANAGGKAFDYTIATLRRRYMNMKALFY